MKEPPWPLLVHDSTGIRLHLEDYRQNRTMKRDQAGITEVKMRAKGEKSHKLGKIITTQEL